MRSSLSSSRMTMARSAAGHRWLPFVAIVLAACQESAAPPTSPESLSPAFAKPAPSEPVTTATFRFPATLTTGLMSDGVQPVNDVVSYFNGQCGVGTRIFTETGASGDATMQTRNPLGKDKNCPQYPRRLRIRYVDANGVQIDRTSRAFLNVRTIATAGDGMAVGETRAIRMALTLWDAGPGCSEWRWNPEFQGVPNGSNYVSVTRTAPTLYEVSTAPGARAYCIDDGRTYELAARLTVEASRAP